MEYRNDAVHDHTSYLSENILQIGAETKEEA
jgi:hypothetical protein